MYTYVPYFLKKVYNVKKNNDRDEIRVNTVEFVYWFYTYECSILYIL